VALWGGGAVHWYATDGTLTDRITLPARQTTACAFGGTTLYITSSRDGLGDLAEPARRGRLRRRRRRHRRSATRLRRLTDSR
jgi:sugar lactone lactonase YvrE